MKLYAFKNTKSGCIALAEDSDFYDALGNYNLIAEIECKEPKKTVVKEAGNLTSKSTGDKCWIFYAPREAQNIKCTYEVEE